MSYIPLLRKLKRLAAKALGSRALDHAVMDLLRNDPGSIMATAGLPPDSWQVKLLRTDFPRRLLCCSRQSGKSTVSAALALNTALLRPRSPVLLLSPSLRQSSELFRKVLELFNALGRPIGVIAESALRIEFSNGSRIVALPGDEKNVRCFSGVAMLIIDEAARVSDSLYCSVRPMLAVSQGRLVALSTPYGKRGWFFDEWNGPDEWERVKITAPECPRITPEFLAVERRALGERWFTQEFLCSFQETIDSVFSAADIEAAFTNDVEPLVF